MSTREMRHYIFTPLIATLFIFSFAQFICLFPNTLVFGQNESIQIPQPGGSPGQSNTQSSDDSQTQQQKMRCSNGSIVERPSECPSSDMCPSSPSTNETIQCSASSKTNSGNSNDLGNNKSDTTATSEFDRGGQSQVTITTDKKTYNPGEIVDITIKNTGTEPLTFPNSILGLTIENAHTREKYPLFAAQVITVLDSDGAKSIKWDQKDSSGQQVRPGNYTASVATGSLIANTTFFVSG